MISPAGFMAAPPAEASRRTMAEFAEAYGLSLTWKDNGPAGAGWTPEHRAYACMIRGAGGKPLRVTFHMNPAASKQAGPTVEDVLNCLALDAAGVENAHGFNDWYSEYGSVDSLTVRELRAQQRVYAASRREAAKLRALLGEAAYEELLWNTESL